MPSLTTLLSRLFYTLCPCLPVPRYTGVRFHGWKGHSQGCTGVHRSEIRGWKGHSQGSTGQRGEQHEQTAGVAVTAQCHEEVHDGFPNGSLNTKYVDVKTESLALVLRGDSRGVGTRGSMKSHKGVWQVGHAGWCEWRQCFSGALHPCWEAQYTDVASSIVSSMHTNLQRCERVFACPWALAHTAGVPPHSVRPCQAVVFCALHCPVLCRVPTPVFLPGESPWTEERGGPPSMGGHKESDSTEQLSVRGGLHGVLVRYLFQAQGVQKQE